MKRLTRTTALVAIGTVASLVSCGSSSSNPPPAKAENDAGTEAGAEAGFDAGPRISDSTSATNRAACMYARGALPAATLGTSIPIGGEIPIENFVVVMMENHSFDSYLGHLNQYANRTDVESAPATATNPDMTGGPQPWTHAPHLCSLDTDHSWAGTRKEIDNGLMDGFAQVNEGTPVPAAPDGGMLDPTLGGGGRALWWYDQTDLPLYYKLASTFAIADHYHCAVPGPTWPNRIFLYAATSFGNTQTGVLPTIDASKYPYPGNPESILDELEASKTSWMYYSDTPLPVPVLLYTTYAKRWNRTVTANFAAFQAAAQAGKLPQVSFVDPNLNITPNGSGSEPDEHPPGDIQTGQLFVSQVVQAVMASPQWPHTAILITHDEHGGFYDHVSPPQACAPDSIAPVLAAGDTTQGGFDLYGVRVILIAVSPYSKKGYVGHHVYDHTSITRFIEAKFNLPALTARDANAEPLTDLFDFSNAPAFLTPPTIASPPVDAADLAYCTSTFGN
jgi:phospholipase C